MFVTTRDWACHSSKDKKKCMHEFWWQTASKKIIWRKEGNGMIILTWILGKQFGRMGSGET
jgi:hypothetical protein